MVIPMQVLFSSGETPDIFLIFFNVCVFKVEYVVYEVRRKRLFSWSGAFMPSEGEFLSFIFLCVRVGFFFHVQIKLKLLLKLPGHGLVMGSHSSVATSPKRVEVLKLNTWSSPSREAGAAERPCPAAALQRRYSGHTPIMGHCNSSEIPFYRCIYGVLCLIIRLTWICVCSCFFSILETTLLSVISKH